MCALKLTAENTTASVRQRAHVPKNVSKIIRLRLVCGIYIIFFSSLKLFNISSLRWSLIIVECWLKGSITVRSYVSCHMQRSLKNRTTYMKLPYFRQANIFFLFRIVVKRYFYGRRTRVMYNTRMRFLDPPSRMFTDSTAYTTCFISCKSTYNDLYQKYLFFRRLNTRGYTNPIARRYVQFCEPFTPCSFFRKCKRERENRVVTVRSNVFYIVWVKYWHRFRFQLLLCLHTSAW